MTAQDVYTEAASIIVANLTEEYERRLNAAADRGPSFAHEADYITIDIERHGEQAAIRLNLPPEMYERAVADIVSDLKQRFERVRSRDAPTLEGFTEVASVQDLIHGHAGDLNQMPGSQIEKLLGLGSRSTVPATARPREIEGHYHTAASLAWQRLREAVASGRFSADEAEGWPTTNITTPSQKLRGHAMLKPRRLDDTPYVSPEAIRAWAKLMWEHSKELSDLDADILDALAAIWLSQAKNPTDSAFATVDDLL